MHKAYYLFWLIPLVGLALILRATYEKVTPLQYPQTAADVNTPELQGPVRVGQTFSADYPGLSAVALRLTHWGRTNTEDVIFHLTAWPDTKKELATSQINARDVVRDHDFYRFVFPPIPDSQGKLFSFYLESPTSKPGNAISGTQTKGNVYTGGAAYLGDRPLEQDLTFITYYQPNPWQMAGILLERMAAKKPWVWGQPAFYVALFALYLVLAAAFFWQVLRLAAAGPEEEPQDAAGDGHAGQ